MKIKPETRDNKKTKTDDPKGTQEVVGSEPGSDPKVGASVLAD